MRDDERFYIESDSHDEPTIWRIDAGFAGQDKAVLRKSDVKDADLWALICKAVTG